MFVEYYIPTNTTTLHYINNDNIAIVEYTTTCPKFKYGKFVYNDDDKNFYLFNELLENQRINEVWILEKSCDKIKWKLVICCHTPFLEQYKDFSICYLKNYNTFFMFGGLKLPEHVKSEFVNTCWYCSVKKSKLNSATNFDSDYISGTWKQIQLLPLPGNKIPSKRSKSLIAYDSDTFSILIFGGINEKKEYITDVWSFNLLTNIWTEIHVNPNNVPNFQDFEFCIKFEYYEKEKCFFLTTKYNIAI